MSLPSARTINQYGSYPVGAISRSYNGTVAGGLATETILFGQFVRCGTIAGVESNDDGTPAAVSKPGTDDTTVADTPAIVKYISGVATPSANARLLDNDGNIVGYRQNDPVIYTVKGYCVVLAPSTLTFSAGDAVTIDANGLLSNKSATDVDEVVPNIVVSKYGSADLQDITLPYTATGVAGETTYKLIEVRLTGLPIVLGQGG